MPKKITIAIYTDGACSGNPGPGGCGSIVVAPRGDSKWVHEIGAGAPQTTNNRMEMAAAIRALDYLELESPEETEILIYTDSTYMIQGVTKWVWGWKSRNWKTAEGKDVSNKELWEELLRAVARLKPATIEWNYVRGHNGDPGNERCDEIAVAYSTNKKEPLYDGPIDGYFVDLSEPPQVEIIPERGGGRNTNGSAKGSPGAKPEAGFPCYLVLDNGVLCRFRDWSSCERYVKGRNVKFKKVKSTAEQRQALIDWGQDPSADITDC
ncbi:MAG TPA: ribonuclease HI [Planktothrix sp.]